MTLVWNEEFNVEVKPHPSSWRYEIGYVRNQELQWYQPDNATIKGGVLVIEGRRQKIKNPYYIAGSSDWGVQQRPGAFETMQSRACTRMLGCHLVDGAGHWVQQEQPAEVNRLLIDFLAQTNAAR